jgi:hypothetical protein
MALRPLTDEEFLGYQRRLRDQVERRGGRGPAAVKAAASLRNLVLQKLADEIGAERAARRAAARRDARQLDFADLAEAGS